MHTRQDLTRMAARLLDNSRYHMNQNLLANPASRRRFQSQPPHLTESQKSIVHQLRQDGIALVPFTQFFGQQAKSKWAPLATSVETFMKSQEVQAGLIHYKQSFSQWLQARHESKPNTTRPPADFIAHYFCGKRLVEAHDPVLAMGLDPLILDTVNSVFQLWAKLREIDIEYKIPHFDRPRPRISAQKWHRDSWEQIKVFLYFSNVGEGNGALEYIPGSRRGGPYADLWRFPKGRGKDYYLHPSEELIEQTVPTTDRVRCSGPRGTLVFCDSSGLHRGGFARDTARIMMVWGYHPPASLGAQGFFLRHAPSAGSLSAAAAYALP